MPVEHNAQIPPPPLPSLTILDLISQGYGDVNDYFPQSGQGQAIVAPYLDEVDRLNDLLETNETDLQQTLNTLDQLLPQILDNARFVPSDDFQQKVDELRVESLQSPQDLAKMLQLAQDALAAYNALSDEERLEEAWNKAQESFRDAYQRADYASQFNSQDEDVFKKAQEDMQAFQDLYDNLKNDPDLSEDAQLRYEALNNDAAIYQQILDLYLDNINVLLGGNFYIDEVNLYWELSKGAWLQFLGQNKPNADMTNDDWRMFADKVNGLNQRRWSLTLTEVDKMDMDNAQQKLQDYIYRYENNVTDFGVPANSANETSARDDLQKIRMWQGSYDESEDRFDNSKPLNDAQPDLNTYATQYNTTQSMGLTQLYPAGGNLAMNDIVQGQLGDCFYLAAIAAIAGKDQDLIKNNIVDNGDGTYEVTLHLQGVQETTDTNGDVVLERTDDPSERNPIKITVTPTFPVDASGESAYASSDNGNNVYWVHILEKALAQAMGGYDNITEGGFSDEALRMLTGDEVREFNNWNDPDNLNKLKTQLDKGKIVTTGSAGMQVISNFTLSPGVTNNNAGTIILEGNHACAVTGYDAATQKFQLYNPHGWSFEVDEADFTTFFSGFNVLDYED